MEESKVTTGDSITIKSDPANPIDVEIMAQSIIDISDGFKKVLDSKLNRGALVVLLRHGIGWSKISSKQINAVLNALPALESWYIKS